MIGVTMIRGILADTTTSLDGLSDVLSTTRCRTALVNRIAVRRLAKRATPCRTVFVSHTPVDR